MEILKYERLHICFKLSAFMHVYIRYHTRFELKNKMHSNESK